LNKNTDTAHNRIVSARPCGAGLRKTAVGLTPFVRFFTATFLRLLETYGFFYRNSKNVIYSRDVIRHGAKIVGIYCIKNYTKRVDKRKQDGYDIKMKQVIRKNNVVAIETRTGLYILAQRFGNGTLAFLTVLLKIYKILIVLN
jgi:hypothetical protein